MKELSVNDVLNLISTLAQHFREQGENDMRGVLNCIRLIREQIASGKSREEIIELFNEDCD